MAVLLAAATAGGACGKAGFVEPVTKFQDASSVVIASTRVYVTELNKVEREHYLNTQASTKAQVKLSELEEVQVFNSDGLKARLDALDQLSRYGVLLSRLAKSDAPERINAEAQSLGDSLKGLTKTVDALAGSSNGGFKAAVGPVSALFGEVLGLVVEQRIRDALKKAVDQGEQPINRLLDVIATDINVAYERRRSTLSSMRGVLVDQYNVEQQKPSADLGRLRALVDQIRAHEDRWEVFASSNPATGLVAMQQAHSALIKYARSAGKLNDLASLVEAMETFSARAKRVGQAVAALRDI